MSGEKLPSGLKIKDTQVGTGAVAERGKLVTIHYRCWQNKGESCGNSHETGQPYSFILGRRQAIAGLEYGVEGMRVGGIRQIVISPHLAYGKNKVAALPANAALRFEIELLNIQSPDPHQIPTTK